MDNNSVQKFREDYELVKENKKGKSEERIIESATRNIKISSQDSNKILVFCGNYKIEKHPVLPDREYLTYEKDYSADFKLYIDIENGDIYKVKCEDSKKFEESNKVIKLPVTIYNYQEYYKNYNKVRNYFFSQLVKEPQEKVVKKLVNKNNLPIE